MKVTDESYKLPGFNKVAGNYVFIPAINSNAYGEVADKRAGTYKRITGDRPYFEWLQATTMAVENIGAEELYEKSLSSPDSEFVQALSDPGSNKKIRVFSPPFENTANAIMTGLNAVTYSRRAFGSGVPITVPLYHSGFHLTFRAPSALDFVLLYQQITAVKIKQGYETAGLGFGGESVLFERDIINFCLRYMVESSLNTATLPDQLTLLDVIDINDYASIPIGVMSAYYINGFNYRRACMSEDENCTHVDTGRINIGKLWLPNRQRFTDDQIKFLAKKAANTYSYSDIRQYQESVRYLQERDYTYDLPDDKLVISFKSPSIRGYFDQASQWVDRINAAVSRILGQQATEKERQALLDVQASTIYLGQFSHYVKSLTYEKSGNTIVDAETIQSTLESLSVHDEFVGFFQKSRAAYIDGSVLALACVPGYDCPVCKKPQLTSPKAGFTSVVALDVFKIFFVLTESTNAMMVARAK